MVPLSARAKNTPTLGDEESGSAPSRQILQSFRAKRRQAKRLIVKIPNVQMRGFPEGTVLRRERQLILIRLRQALLPPVPLASQTWFVTHAGGSSLNLGQDDSAAAENFPDQFPCRSCCPRLLDSGKPAVC